MSPPSREANEPIALTKMQEREGMRSAKHQVYSSVKDALMTCDGTLEDLDEEVRKRGVMPDWSFNQDGEFNGASFTLMNSDGSEPVRHGDGDGFEGATYTFKGSQLGPKPGLSRDYINKVLIARQEAVERKQAKVEGKAQRQAERKAQLEERRKAFADQVRAQKTRRLIVGSRVGTTRRRFAAYNNPLQHSAVFSILKLLAIKKVPSFKLPKSFPTFHPPRMR
jgi:hypothetical protein